MSTFIGFSTQDVNQPQQSPTSGAFGGGPLKTIKKFRVTDDQLVIRDLINALSIRQGSKVGQPAYGTTLWSYIFEPNVMSVRTEMETEIRRIISLDARIMLNSVSVYPWDNGVQFMIEMAFAPFEVSTTVGLNIDRNSGTVSRIA